MRFTVELEALVRMIELLAVKPKSKQRSDRMLRLSACAPRVFVAANETVCGVEALVFEDGCCKVPRVRFLKVLQTFHPKPHLTIEVNDEGLRIGGFVMRVVRYSPVATPPGTFQVFPVTDSWLARLQAPTPMNPTGIGRLNL